MPDHRECQHIPEGEMVYATLPFLVDGAPVNVCMACWDMLRARVLQDAIQEGVRRAFLGEAGADVLHPEG
jgi:hypothetical protein